jgi:hypothetical protein
MMMRAGAVHRALAARALCSGLLAACLLLPHATSAADFRKAIFERERASNDVRHVANWVVHAGDNQAGNDNKLPFVIIDKKDARVYVFNSAGRLQGAAPALLGIGIGDTAVPGIGARELSNIAPKDRVTQAGRFVAEIGLDSHGEDVLWLDYEGALAIHRVITTNPKERRAHRLATPTPADNRISFGCINIPVKFYEQVVQPAFTGTKGIVYVLPETKPVHTVFASYDVDDATVAAPPQVAPSQQSPLQRVSDISR